ncbi:MAG: hypothetical protein GKR90_26180 [Pseudomonadales bacterium]|nr:hypothetical protein [Pseudomonadales bacterium]
MAKKKKTSTKKAIKKPTKKRVVKKKVVKEVEVPVVKEHLSQRFYFDIESLVTDGNSLIKEIVFTYTGTLVIPKSLKSIYEKNSVTVHGSYIVKDTDEGVVTTTDYKQLSKSDVKLFLQKYLRDDYINGMQDIIKKDLLPETNLVVDLPW